MLGLPSDMGFQLQPTPRTYPPTTTDPLQGVDFESISSRFLVVFDSMLSRDWQTTQIRLENNQRPTRNRPLGRGVGGGGGMSPGGWAVAEKPCHWVCLERITGKMSETLKLAESSKINSGRQ